MYRCLQSPCIVLIYNTFSVVKLKLKLTYINTYIYNNMAHIVYLLCSNSYRLLVTLNEDIMAENILSILM